MAERHQTLDLRLLPAACIGWVVALVVVHSLPAQSLAWGLGMVWGAGLCLSAALLLADRWSALRRVMLHAVLCTGVGAGVAFSAAHTQHSHQESGWTQAVQSEAPVEVTFRVTRDPLPFEQRGFAGDSGYRTQAVVQSFGAQQQVRAEVMVFTDAELRAGHRYTAMVTAVPADTGDRTTALLHSFGSQAPQRLAADRWSRVTEGFSALRAATAEQSSHAVGDAPALLPGVVLGDRSAQSEELTEAMQISGLTHMTVVSGTHCSLAMGALLGTARMMRLPRWILPPLLLAGLLLFVMLVQPAPSVIRASVMGAIGALAVFAGRGRASSALLCLCVIVLLVYDPWYSVEAAFQLSVAATVGIVLIGARLKTFFAHWLPGFFAGALALAVSAQLFVIPVLLPIAEGVTLYSIPANILAGPLLPLATVPGTLAAVLSTTVPWLSTALLWLAGFPAAGIAVIGHATAALPQAFVAWPQGATGWALAGLYSAAAIMVCRLVVDSTRRAGRAERSVLAATVGALTALVLPATGVLDPLFGQGLPEHWRFALCDVGQGDMLVVRTQEVAAVVVDTGEDPALAAECLDRLGLEQVEILMVTHEHRDHYGGVSGVAEAAEVEHILYSGTAGWSVLEAVQELDEVVLGIPETRAHVGDTAGHHGRYPVNWTVWSAADFHANPNNNSLVVQFELWESETSAGAVGSANNPLRLLTLGDLEEDVARLLVAQEAIPSQSQVVKVSHHGAANGGTEILEHITPSAALIGVGKDNTYGHPADEILGALGEMDASVYRTDLHGTVVFDLAEGGLEAFSVED
ncbi:ComEC/Rec2 family competence protein [Nesterenkonia muleiensis]|uniref:ComEC/Rec2 family competence protein n=1 Tax=Nesterenkonia muleiensis TaxID=2282648 RepID=UPI001300425A|nr:ComEC/Rec2 family competence protein [Nesterenkonia muleiensis]